MTSSKREKDSFTDDKEINNVFAVSVVDNDADKENALPVNWNQNLKSFSAKGDSGNFPKEAANLKSLSTGRALKQTSLQVCMQMNESEKGSFGIKTWDRVESEHSSSLNIWEYSDSEAAPASSWSTLPNRVLLCKTLPLDVGRCTCLIVKENSPEGLNGGTLYALYTHEGRGRKDRKLAVAYHKRRSGKSEFSIAQSVKGILSRSNDGYVGTMTANLIGSKYSIWDQGVHIGSVDKQWNPLLSVVIFSPTIATWTGSYRSMRAFVPRDQPLQKNGKLNANRLANDWSKNTEKVKKLCSRAPHYNKISKRHELDFRDRGRAGLRIQSSVKNFQLVLEENCRQTILQMGRVDKSKYVIDFRYPLTGYQAFCICLASIDSKLCCAV